jgi:N-acetyl-anhydromuramyl-L-alanine amidase AmpD
MNIIQKTSPNFESRHGFSPDMIVNHITAGSNVSSALNWFANSAAQASSHFVVDTDGTAYQCVAIDKCAWGNGTSVTASDKRYYGLSTLDAVKSRKTNANFYTVSIEHVNVSGGALTTAQLAATIELHKYIISEVKRIYGVTIPIDRNHIVGHYQINAVTKPNCPGAYFPFDKILAGLANVDLNYCDTTKDFTKKQGETYVIKTGSNKVTTGNSAIIQTAGQTTSDGYYFTTLKAVGKAGQAAGIFVNGVKKCTATIV